MNLSGKRQIKAFTIMVRDAGFKPATCRRGDR